jgi:dihydrofolate reductase
MSELVSYMFISLDGFIADAGGGLEWTPIDDELMGFANEVFADVDGIVFGRNVYEGFVSYWEHLPSDASPADIAFAEIFKDLDRIVVSNTLDDATGRTVIRDDVAAGIAAAKERARRDLLLICGPTLRSTLADLGLIDRYQMFVAPVVLSEGVPQFGPTKEPIRLRHTATRTFTGGVVMLDYESGGNA